MEREVMERAVGSLVSIADFVLTKKDLFSGGLGPLHYKLLSSYSGLQPEETAQIPVYPVVRVSNLRTLFGVQTQLSFLEEQAEDGSSPKIYVSHMIVDMETKFPQEVRYLAIENDTPTATVQCLTFPSYEVGMQQFATMNESSLDITAEARNLGQIVVLKGVNGKGSVSAQFRYLGDFHGDWFGGRSENIHVWASLGGNAIKPKGNQPVIDQTPNVFPAPSPVTI